MHTEESTTAPVEASAEAAEVTTEATATPEATESESPQEAKPKGVQKRIDELTRDKHEALRRAQWLEQQYELLQKQLNAPKVEEKPKTPQAPQGRPTIDQFEDVDDYIAAVTDWKLEQVEKQREQRAREESQKKTQTENQRRISKQVEKARQKHADFDEVVIHNPDLAITQDMATALVEMGDVGGDVAYHLGKNPQEAARIAQLPPQRQLIELGRLEASLTLNAKRVTSAPAPVGSQITGSAGAGGLSDSMSTKDWIAARNAQLNRQ